MFVMTPDAAAEWRPSSVEELAERLRAATDRDEMLIPMGGATTAQMSPHHWDGQRVSLGALNRLVDYPHRDQTITVEAGMTIAALQQHLAAEGQQLPIDVPQHELATVGGALATNVAGSRRYGHGLLRDSLIGIEAVDGSGRRYSAGGRVVKNVAGYDLCKLLTGSRGALGVITQATFKVRPLPEVTRWVTARYVDGKQLETGLVRLNESAARPVVIDAWEAAAWNRLDLGPSMGQGGVLVVGVEGDADVAEWQQTQLVTELSGVQLREVQAWRDGGPNFLKFATDWLASHSGELCLRAVCRPSLLAIWVEAMQQAGAATLMHAGDGVAYAKLAVSEISPIEYASLWATLKDRVPHGMGHFGIWNWPMGWSQDGLRVSASSAEAAVLRSIKQAFDPQRRLPPLSWAESS